MEQAGRLIRVFVAPGEVFRELREKPTWVLGFLIYWALASTTAFLLTSRVDFIEGIEAQMAAQGQNAPPNLDQAAGMIRGCSTVGGILGPPIVCLLLALIFLGFRLFGGDLDYRRSLAITVHGLMPRTAAALASIPVILSRESFSMQEMKSASFLFSNLSFLASDTTPEALKVLYGNLDVFTIATLVLLAMGFRIAGNVPGKRSYVVVFGLWLLFVGGLVGVTALSSLR